jgi:hypothetical protein
MSVVPGGHFDIWMVGGTTVSGYARARSKVRTTCSLSCARSLMTRASHFSAGLHAFHDASVAWWRGDSPLVWV